MIHTYVTESIRIHTGITDSIRIHTDVTESIRIAIGNADIIMIDTVQAWNSL